MHSHHAHAQPPAAAAISRTPLTRSSSNQKRSLSPPADAGDQRKKPRPFREPINPSSPLPCCAVCLSRKSHHVVECDAPRTWDGLFDTFSQRIKKALWTKDGRQLCTAWQRDEGCTGPQHSHIHACLGCGSTEHGAQRCARAQKA